jgi:hypothetical protein
MPLFPRKARLRGERLLIQLSVECNQEEESYCWCGKVATGAMAAVEELMGGIGGATPAVLEPRPKS